MSKQKHLFPKLNVAVEEMKKALEKEERRKRQTERRRQRNIKRIAKGEDINSEY